MNGTFNSLQIFIFALVIVAIIAINFFIYAMLRKKRKSSEMDAFMKTTQSMRNPFKEEEQDLKTLSEMVSELKSSNENYGD